MRSKAPKTKGDTHIQTLCFFLLCFESEASWLNKKQTTVTSASPTVCATSTARMPGGVNLSLTASLLRQTKKGKRPKQHLNWLFFPTFQGILHASLSLPAACAKHAYFPEGAPEQCGRQFAVALAHVRPTSLPSTESASVCSTVWSVHNSSQHVVPEEQFCPPRNFPPYLRNRLVRGKFPSWLEIGEHIKKQSGHSHSNPEGQRPHATHATLLRPFLVVPTTHVRSDAPWVPRLHCSSQPTRPLSLLLGSGPLDSQNARRSLSRLRNH